MKSSQYRKAINQAKLQPTQGLLIPIEVFVVSAIIGMLAESWLAFGGACLVLATLLFLPVVGPILIGLLSVTFGTVIGIVLYEGFQNIGMSIVVGVAITIVLFSLHLSDLDFLKDVSE